MPDAITIVRDALESWNGGNREAPVEHVHPDCVLITRFAELRGAPYVGHEGLRQSMRDIGEYFEDWRYDIDEWRQEGDLVLAVGRARFRFHGGVADVEQPLAWVFDMRDGKLARWRSFTDRDEAVRELEGAGDRGREATV